MTAKHFASHVTRHESLSLYREILRTSRAFHWCNEQGKPWNKVLKQEARKEFEAARWEKDPLVVARLLVTGRECVQVVQRKFNEADMGIQNRIVNERNRR